MDLKYFTVPQKETVKGQEVLELDDQLVPSKINMRII
jgi:hypothetical protein